MEIDPLPLLPQPLLLLPLFMPALPLPLPLPRAVAHAANLTCPIDSNASLPDEAKDRSIHIEKDTLDPTVQSKLPHLSWLMVYQMDWLQT